MLSAEILDIFLSGQLCGKLFKFAPGTRQPHIRFEAEINFAKNPQQNVLSLSMLAAHSSQQAAFWVDTANNPAFIGVEGRLPPFFQNLLPEGAYRTHIAEARGCREDDHFALLAACGLDLPGAVKALPAHLKSGELAHLVSQNTEAMNIRVTEAPLPLGVALSGMQPKVGLVQQGDQYLARKPQGVSRIIGKLPQIDRPMLPEVEHLSLSLAKAAGANVCEHVLEPLSKLAIEHDYALVGSSNFLAVTRFDREGAKRIHCEDFAQALGVDPQHKYTGASYTAIAALMMRYPETLGTSAVHELLRLITINQLMGNSDAHLKNFCLLYPDGQSPVLSPAFDIVAWAAYLPSKSHALAMFNNKSKSSTAKSQTPAHTLSPASLRELCNRANIPEKPCAAVIKTTTVKAQASWQHLIQESGILPEQKQRLLHRLKENLSPKNA